jgi:putative restriction endonuclease
MAVWWVFQNESFDRSRKGGYLWAPLLDKAGHRKNHWEFVDQVKKGDVVLSSKNRHLIAMSVAKKDAYRANQPDPEDAKLWNLEGRRVDVTYVDIDPQISVDDLVDIFGKNPSENSPLDINGRGKMGYLYPVSPIVATELFERINQTLPVEELITEGISSETAGPVNTTNKRMMDVRLGQDKFRKELLKFYGAKCAVTGVSEVDLLIASHIKPWSISNDYERLDLANGILLEAGIDKLFDKGFISFEPTGQILISSKLTTENIEALGISTELRLLKINPHASDYLKFHKEKLFKN